MACDLVGKRVEISVVDIQGFEMRPRNPNVANVACRLSNVLVLFGVPIADWSSLS